MERDQALEMALGQIEKQYGKGDHAPGRARQRRRRRHPTGAWRSTSPSASAACPAVVWSRSTARVVREVHPRHARGCRGPAQRRRVAYIDAEHAMDPVYASAIGVNVDELLISQPDTGEQALRSPTC